MQMNMLDMFGNTSLRDSWI